MKRLDIKKWDRFGKYVVISEWEQRNNNSRWFLCKCECWLEKEVQLSSLVKWMSCLKCSNKRNDSEWMSKTIFYRKYSSIVIRCTNKKSDSYISYGWRWIKCEWSKFINFKNDMYESYIKHCELFWIKNTTIDRIDVNWNYSKNNCKWSTIKEQWENKRWSVKYKWKLIRDICKEKWINENVVFNRINNLWWNIKDAIYKKTNKAKLYDWKKISEWANIFWIKRQTLNSRINISWMSIQEALSFNK